MEIIYLLLCLCIYMYAITFSYQYFVHTRSTCQLWLDIQINIEKSSLWLQMIEVQFIIL